MKIIRGKKEMVSWALSEFEKVSHPVANDNYKIPLLNSPCSRKDCLLKNIVEFIGFTALIVTIFLVFSVLEYLI